MSTIIVCLVTYNAAFGGLGLVLSHKSYIVRSYSQCHVQATKLRSGAGTPHVVDQEQLLRYCGPNNVDCEDVR